MAYEPFVGYGTRKGVLYELDAFNLPNAASSTAYRGLEIYGIRAFALPPVAVRIIPHFDGDKVALTQVFPPNTAPTGTITVDGSDTALVAVVSSTTKSTVGLYELVPYLSSSQGSEPNIGLLVYQAARKTTGATGWHVMFVPSTTAIPQNGQFGDNNYETTYQLSPSASPNHLFAKAFATGDEGVSTAGLVDGFGLYKPRITAWKADGATLVFTFATGLNAVNTTYDVYKFTASSSLVAKVTTGVTKATTGITFDTAHEPASGDKLFVLHGVA